MLAQHRDEKRRGVDLYRARYGSRFDFVEEFTRCDLLESREVVKQAVNTRPHLVQQPGSKARDQTQRPLLALPKGPRVPL